MHRRCETCRYWQMNRVEEGKTCNRVGSDMRFKATDADYSCSLWIPEIEQDGDATWFLEAITCRSEVKKGR